MSQNFYYPPGSAAASSITANQGTPAAVGNAWPIKVTDGTNTAPVSATNGLTVNIAGTVPLPTGAATSANQLTEITALNFLGTPIATFTQPYVAQGIMMAAVDTSNNAAPLIQSPIGLGSLYVGLNSEGVNGNGAPSTMVVVAGRDFSDDVASFRIDSGNLKIAADQLPTTLGAKTIANSMAVNIASDQTVPVSISSVPLPTGAATSALQTAGNASLVSIDSKLTSPLAVTGPLTDTQLRASAVPVSAASLPLPTGAATAANQATEIASLSSIDSKLTSPLTVTGPLTDTQLRATPVPISGTVSTGGLTDAQLRASAVPVSIAASVAVTGPLTDTQLRASAVPVSLTSTTITGSVAVTGPLTDTQLRASAVPVLTSPNAATTTALANVSGSASSVAIIGSNSARKGLYIFNDSTATLYLKLNSGSASTTSYTVQIPSNGYYELPSSPAIYTGDVNGVWSSATGAARITEVS